MIRFCLTLCVLTFAAHAPAAGEARSKVISNGHTAPVYFNDGDTFRVLTGPLAGTKARLAGFNTLESFGPVHIWPGLSGRELYVNAKTATQFARRGIWRCTSDMDRDTYGRALFDCPELAVAHIRLGLAHAMTVTAQSSSALYLDAQHEAQAKRRGMWAKGTPRWVLTSLHSLDERPDYKTTYNRVVSSRDGHSEKWIHSDVYPECTTVCLDEVDVDLAGLEAFNAQLVDHPVIKAMWRALSEPARYEIAELWLVMGVVSTRVPKPLRAEVEAALRQAVDSGVLKAAARRPGTCMVYTDFRRRFGGGKATCLKLHR
jgi:endonuclease YncB( thermonuclease family)